MFKTNPTLCRQTIPTKHGKTQKERTDGAVSGVLTGTKFYVRARRTVRARDARPEVRQLLPLTRPEFETLLLVSEISRLQLTIELEVQVHLPKEFEWGQSFGHVR